MMTGEIRLNSIENRNRIDTGVDYMASSILARTACAGPFYLRAGKCLPTTCTEVVVGLRRATTLNQKLDLQPNEGDATLFARQDYAEEAWRIVDPVLTADTPVHEYKPETWGPPEVDRVTPPGGWHNPRPEEASS